MSIKCINSPSNRGDKRNIVISVYRSPDMGGSVHTAVNWSVIWIVRTCFNSE